MRWLESIGRKSRLCHFLLRAGVVRRVTLKYTRCTPARVGFVNVPNDSLPTLCYIPHCRRPLASANTFLYSCTFSCHSHLSLSLFSSSLRRGATECWIKRKKQGITAVVARISRNKSTPRFSFSSFFSFSFLTPSSICSW